MLSKLIRRRRDTGSAPTPESVIAEDKRRRQAVGQWQSQQKKRLRFARDHVQWTEDDWSKVLFTDESKFELFGTNRRMFVRRRKNELYINACLSPTVKYGGGSIMVWGAISLNGMGKLNRIHGIMDQRV